MRFDRVSRKQVIRKVEAALVKKKPCLIFTPNPEMCVEANQNGYFRDVLNSSDINICDGFGTYLVAKFLHKTSLERITGVSLFLDICRQVKAKIFLLGAVEGVAQECKARLEEKFPGIQIVGTFSGSDKEKDFNKIKGKINKSEAKILFVAFGAPKQEIFLHERISDLPRIKVAMGVGGSFDFVAGKIKRAPYFMRILGLEWLFRLILEPRRIKRIWNATFRFLFLVFRHRDYS